MTLVCPLTREQHEAVEAYCAVRARLDVASARENAAFLRYFKKREAGQPTNGAAWQHLANEANYITAELAQAQGKLYRLDLDPWDVDDADGHERTFVG